MTIRVDKEGGGQRVNAECHGGAVLCVIVHGEGIAHLVDEVGGTLDRLSAAGHVDHQKVDLIAQLQIFLMEFRHLRLAGTAPTGPKVQYDGLSKEIGEMDSVAAAVVDGEVGYDVFGGFGVFAGGVGIFL